MSYLFKKSAPSQPQGSTGQQQGGPTAPNSFGLSLSREQLQELMDELNAASVKADADKEQQPLAMRSMLKILKLVKIASVTIEAIESI